MKSVSAALLLSAILPFWMPTHAEEDIQQPHDQLDSLRGIRQTMETNDHDSASRGSSRTEKMARVAALSVEDRRELFLRQELSMLHKSEGHGRFLNTDDLLCGTSTGEVGCGRCGEPFLCCCDSSCHIFQDCCSNYEGGICDTGTADLVIETPKPSASPTITPAPTQTAPSHVPSASPTSSPKPSVTTIPSALPTLSQVPSHSPTNAPTTPGYCSGKGKDAFGEFARGIASGVVTFEYHFFFKAPGEFFFVINQMSVEGTTVTSAMISTFSPDLGTSMATIPAGNSGGATAPVDYVNQLAFCPDEFYLIVSYEGGFSVGRMRKD